MGKIYVIESGSDACGKATQSKLLYDVLSKNNKVIKVEFPNYQSDTSFMVKMYLRGDFGKNPEDVDPYIASTFYAIDRYGTYKKEIEKYYNDDYIIIADRYTTSSMVYQAGKYEDIKEKNKFLDWLYDFEYRLYGLPKPDKVFFLDLPFDISYNFMKNRESKNNILQDIHENNRKYLEKVYENSKYVAEKYGWLQIDCSVNGNIKSIDEIHSMILEKI